MTSYKAEGEPQVRQAPKGNAVGIWRNGNSDGAIPFNVAVLPHQLPVPSLKTLVQPVVK